MRRTTTVVPMLLVLCGRVGSAQRPPPRAATPRPDSTAPAKDALTRFLEGFTYRNLGPAAYSGRVTSLAVPRGTPYPKTMYVGAAGGGVWKTANGGITWQAASEGLGVQTIGDLAVAPSDSGLVWVGTGERNSLRSQWWGDGVYKSTDGGKKWTNMGLADTRSIGRIVLHPTNPDIVYVAALGHLWGANRERGLFKSIDGGKTWKVSLQIDEDTGVSDVAMDPSDPNTLYAAAHQRRRRAYGFHGGGPGNALYKSTDGGEHWKKLTNGLPAGELGRIGISIYRKDPRVVYVCVEQGMRYNASTAYEQRKAGVYRSDDKGETWKFMSDWNPRPTYASQIRVDPNDDQRVYMVNYSYSDDGGKTFVSPRQSLHGDDRMVWIDPRCCKHLLKADDLGA